MSWSHRVELLGVPVHMMERPVAAHLTSIEKLEQSIGRELPPDYRSVLLQCGPFEGFIGSVEEGGYFRLGGPDSVIQATTDYEIPEGLLLVGSDGGGEAFLWEFATGEWIEIPFMDIYDWPESRLARRFPTLSAVLRDRAVRDS